jgi:hypothetical protein
VASQAHDSCQFSWIISQGQMKGTPLFFIIFRESLSIKYTTSELATYLEEALGITKYHHQDNGIPNTRFMSVLLDHGSGTNERDTVNTSGKAGAQIPHPPLGDDSSPWGR